MRPQESNRSWSQAKGSTLESGAPLRLSCRLLVNNQLSQSATGLMKASAWRRFVTLLCFVLLFSAVSPLAWAQNYSIDWYKLAGGGGTSTGGVYSVSGTFAQDDAGAMMTGGNYSLTAGFWSVLTVAYTPGSPRLTILLTPTNTAVVYWPSASAGFNLQQNTTVGPANWLTASETISDDGKNKFITVHPSAGTRFYRLLKP